MKKLFNFSFIILLLIDGGCQKSNPDPVTPVVPKGFTAAPEEINLNNQTIKEGSGIADSKINPGYLWVEEDSGNPAALWLLGHDGTVNKSIPITGATNRDWEDIVVAVGPAVGKNYIYIAETGDNNQVDSSYSYYRFEEPAMSSSSVMDAEKIVFKYPDGPHDSEAFMVDGNTKDIYLITKRDALSGIYKIAYPQSVSDTNEAEFVGKLPYTGVVSAALSDDGTEIIIKTYTSLLYYTKTKTADIADALQSNNKSLDYKVEAQGESVCFAADNKGFYTFSEYAQGVIPTLNYYKRN